MGGTGINTSSSTGIATVSSGTWSIASFLGVATGGTGTTTQFTQGSVVFAGASGVYSQDNSGFYWDDTNNRLGIGTASPQQSLDVENGSHYQLRLGYSSSTGLNYDIGRNVGTGFLNFYGNQSGAIGYVFGGVDRTMMTILNSGNVGIGTASPSQKLSVAGTLGIQGGSYYSIFQGGSQSGDITYTLPTSQAGGSGYVLSNNGSGVLSWAAQSGITGTGTSGYVAYWNGTGTLSGEQYLSASRGGTGLDTSSSTGIATVSSGTWSIASSLGVAQGGTGTATQFTPGSLVFAGASGVYSQDNSNFFWDDSNNRLGIGTSSPVATLHVAGSSTVFGTGEGGTPADFTFRGAAGSGSNIAGGDIYFDASNGTGAGGSGDFIFRTAAPADGGGITFDATSTGHSSGTTSLSWSHTVGSNDSRLLIVGVSVGTTTNVSSVTYGGVSLTRLTYKDNGSQNRTELWYLKNPSSGAANIVVNMASSAMLTAGATSWYNVDQDTTFGTPVTASGSTTTPTVNVSSAVNDMVVDVVAGHVDMGSASLGVGSGQTQRWNYGQTESVMNGEAGAGSNETGASTVSMSWSLSGGAASSWSISAVSIKPALNTSVNNLAERMRITDAGKIGIGTSSPTEALTVYNGSTTGTYTTSGWAHSSDARLKTNVTALGGALDTVSRLQGVSFNWKTNPAGDRQIGFIAQDVLGVLPEVVTGSEEEGYGIAYGNLTALLVEAVKELHAEQGAVAASLESRLDTLDLGVDMNATTFGGLQSSVNTQLAIVGDSLSTLGKETDTLDGRLAALDDPDAGRLTTLDSRILSLEKTVGLSNATLSHETRIAQIESEMTTLRDEHLALMEFFSTFELGDVIRKDALGNVDLLGGKLTLGTLVADKLCLEDVCVTKTQLQGMLDATGQAAAEPASEAVAPTASGAVAGVSTDSSGVGSTFETWAGNIDAGWTEDYLMVLDENAYVSGEGNVSGYSVSYDVDLSGAKKKAKLTVEFSPTADPSGIDKLTALRIFTPEGSWLAAMSGNDGNAEFPGVFRGKKSFVIPVRISATLGRKVVVEYTLPDATTAIPYDLKIQKQAGVGAVPIAVSVIAPDGTKTEKNITLDTDFVTRVQ